MVTVLTFLRTITLLAVTASLCSAHVGDRLIPVFEIPDKLLSDMDVHDGDIEDWVNVIGEPSLTGLDLTPVIGGTYGEEYDPSDLDFRVWMAWHRETNRIYVAAEGVDDVLVGAEGNSYHEAVVGVSVDGDHSGGIFSHSDGDESKWVSVQTYAGGPFGYLWNTETTKDRPDYCNIGNQEATCWFSLPPFADAGGATYGANPAIWIVEMYVTPIDRLDPHDVDNTVISELVPEKIIGFTISILDDDSNSRGSDATFAIPPIPDYGGGPDYFADGLLIPVGGTAESAVQSVSWGRIKASLGLP